jgi:hypothetical protein
MDHRTNTAISAIWRRIDPELGAWIEKETEKMANKDANGEELPDIVTGGDILPGAKLSGGPLNEKLHSVLEGGHLFDLVAKGYGQKP